MNELRGRVRRLRESLWKGLDFLCQVGSERFCRQKVERGLGDSEESESLGAVVWLTCWLQSRAALR